MSLAAPAHGVRRYGWPVRRRWCCSRCGKPRRRRAGLPAAEPGNIAIALRPLLKLYGRTEAAEFGPRALFARREFETMSWEKQLDWRDRVMKRHPRLDRIVNELQRKREANNTVVTSRILCVTALGPNGGRRLASLAHPHHRYNSHLDRVRQFGPCVDHKGQIRVGGWRW